MYCIGDNFIFASMSLEIKQIAALVKKDLLLEFRQQHSFFGIVLYVFCTVFVVYLTMGSPEEMVWNGLFWIVQLFVCINAVTKSFAIDSNGRMLYYYSLSNPTNFIVAKLLYNAILMCVFSSISFLVFLLFLQNPFQYIFLFWLIALLGGVGLSFVFSFLSSIAAKAKQQAALMAIMGFPVIIPQLLLLMKISTIAFSNVVQSGLWQMIGLLFALNCLVIVLAYILFPFLWKD